jgi:hypothetical protein
VSKSPSPSKSPSTDETSASGEDLSNDHKSLNASTRTSTFAKSLALLFGIVLAF